MRPRGKSAPHFEGGLKAEAVAVRVVLGLLARRRGLFFCLLLASILTALFEGLGIGVIIALLEEPQVGTGTLEGLPLLGSFSLWLNDLAVLDRVRFAAAALLAIVLLRGVFAYASETISVLLQIEIDRALRRRVFEQIMAVELRFVQRERMGTLITILNTYTRQAGRIVLFVANGISRLFTIAILVTLMLFVSWQLTAAALVLQLGIMGLLRGPFARRVKQAGRAVNEAQAQLNFVGVESISAIHLIHLFSQEPYSIRRFESALDAYQTSAYQSGKLMGLTRPLFNTANTMVLSLLLMAGTLFLPAQIDRWIALMVIFVVIAFRLMPPASELNHVRIQVNNFYPALEQVLDFLRQEDKPYLKNGHVRFEALKEEIALEDVTFHYVTHEAPVLQEVTFEIPRGKMTAVVGASGAGKTTLVNLVARLYDCQGGRVAVDGVDVRNLDIASWHARVAVVTQDAFIFNDTVSANIRFAREGATEEEVQQAACLANAHGFVAGLPQGYETVLGDRGVRLSGGQRQRIAIARAILADPQLLILDEATSHLDSEIERSIQEAIERIRQDCTVLVIAHRLSTIRHADNIVVLDAGRVVEQGTHEDLIQRQGHYWRLIQAQSLAETPTEIAGGERKA